MDFSLSSQGGIVTPVNRLQRVRTTGNLVVGLNPNVLLVTLPLIGAARNPVTISATVMIVIATSDTTLQLKIQRDGVDVGSPDVWQALASQVGFVLMSCEWVDDTPGNTPVYTLLGTGTGTTPGITVRERQLVARVG